MHCTPAAVRPWQVRRLSCHRQTRSAADLKSYDHTPPNVIVYLGHLKLQRIKSRTDATPPARRTQREVHTTSNVRVSPNAQMAATTQICRISSEQGQRKTAQALSRMEGVERRQHSQHSQHGQHSGALFAHYSPTPTHCHPPPPPSLAVIIHTMAIRSICHTYAWHSHGKHNMAQQGRRK